MYVVFYGTDRGGVRDEASSYIEAKMPKDATLTTLESGEYMAGQVADALGANSLFGGDEWFVFDGPMANGEFYEEVKSALKELTESPNTFVILEDALLAAPKKAYEKYAESVTMFTADKAERFNSFSLAEALAGKDKRKLWVLVQDARLAGLRDEEIIGMLWWQLKALRLAARTSSAAEAGMKDFPYNKAKRSLTAFGTGEVERISQSLLELYHEGHAGVKDMDSALEQWVLGL
jgi:DNA polymerase III delta subunit